MHVRFNTVQLPILGNGLAIYGGYNNTMTDNVVADTVMSGAGIQIADRFGAVPMAGVVTLARNSLWRCGSPGSPGHLVAPPAGLSFLLGQFTLGDGRTAVMLQNQDDRLVATPNVTIASHLAQKHCCQVSPKDGPSSA